MRALACAPQARTPALPIYMYVREPGPWRRARLPKVSAPHVLEMMILSEARRAADVVAGCDWCRTRGVSSGSVGATHGRSQGRDRGVDRTRVTALQSMDERRDITGDGARHRGLMRVVGAGTRCRVRSHRGWRCRGHAGSNCAGARPGSSVSGSRCSACHGAGVSGSCASTCCGSGVSGSCASACCCSSVSGSRSSGGNWRDIGWGPDRRDRRGGSCVCNLHYAVKIGVPGGHRGAGAALQLY